MAQIWSTPVREYCERTDPGLWAEPANALSNIAFLIAAAFVVQRWRRAGGNDAAALALSVVLVAVGLGSFAFHTLATRGAALLDVIPIAVFIYGYLLLSLRRFLQLPRWAAVGILAAFAAFSLAVQRLAPPAFLDGSVGYLPALTAMVLVGGSALRRARRRVGRSEQQPADEAQRERKRANDIGLWLFGCAALFGVSLTLRSVDMAICDRFPLGTHFLWHLLNAAVLYGLLRGAVNGGGTNAADPPA